MALSVLVYNLTLVMNIVGIKRLIAEVTTTDEADGRILASRANLRSERVSVGREDGRWQCHDSGP